MRVSGGLTADQGAGWGEARRWSASVGWGMWVVATAAILASVFLAASNPPPSTTEQVSVVESLVWLSSWVGFGFMGALVVANRPRTPIGWILSGITFGIATALLSTDYARYALVTAPGTVPLGSTAAWLGTWVFVPTLGLVILLVLLFPTGSPQGRGGRWLGRALAVLVAGETVAYAVRPGPIVGDVPPDNRLGIPGARPFLDSATGILGILLAALAIAVLVQAIFRYRHAGGVERQQFRWFVLAVAAFPLLFFSASLLEGLIGYESFDPVAVAFALGGNGMAAAIGLAILRYRLYDIDLVINRTLVYGSLTLLLGAVYVTGAVGLPQVLPLARDNDFLVAGSTLAVAALFSPLRRRIQGFVDRRFYRRRYDARRTIEAFSQRLRGEVDLEELVSNLRRVVEDTVQPRSVTVWIREVGR